MPVPSLPKFPTNCIRFQCVSLQMLLVLSASKQIILYFALSPCPKVVYRKNNGNRLTEYRNAIVQIKNFQPVFCRVPVGNNVRKLTIDYHLILEVGSIDVLGSEGEGEFGNPIDIDDNEKVMAWTKGLREHGGGG